MKNDPSCFEVLGVVVGIALIPANVFALLVVSWLFAYEDYPWQAGRLFALLTGVGTIAALVYSVVGSIPAFFRSRPVWFVPRAAFFLLLGALLANFIASVLYFEWLSRDWVAD